jgi:pimeloyl-ACP methyl ester carboxylesterase
VPVVVAAGSEGTDLIGHRSAVALAARLGTDVALLPGGHAGFAEHPAAFLDRLVELLAPL